ncbi:DUF4364 family protein [Clostridium bornimense]|uniref:DUF4364 family protein n=1 Tax=Clostridium bornimense TaxID=1216932 RepID=UPI001C11CAA1|nr:DUF4364 family protein [Clostridium bornimense]MBU5315069.1 DUF4364 family protein [Clostridium bornimense]
MFDDTLDLAENKLLLLYIFRELDVPVTRNLITEIILENNFLNYFILQPYLSELISSNFLLEFESEDVHKLKITEKGLTALELFENRLSEDKKSLVDQYLCSNLNTIKNKIAITADYTIENDNAYIVHLKAEENKSILVDLKVSVGSNKQARNLCKKWKENSSSIYTNLMNLLFDEQ